MFEAKCPKCKKSLYSKIYSKWIDSVKDEFDFKCPFCKTKLYIETIEDPIFVVQKKVMGRECGIKKY